MQPDAERDSGAKRWLCVSLHDVAPATWDGCRRVLAAVREVTEAPVTLLVVPAYHGACSAQPDFERAMTTQLAAGNELALHGYFHVDHQVPGSLVDWFRRRVYTAGEGEFCGLSAAEAAERLTLGRRWFSANHWPLSGFVAPAWLLGVGAWKGLQQVDWCGYTSTLTTIVMLPEMHAIRAPCFTYSVRKTWRRPTSITWNAMLSRLTTDSPVLRLGLHPRDAEFKSVRRSWQRLLARALETRSAVTKEKFVQQWRRAAADPSKLKAVRSHRLQERGLLDSQLSIEREL